MTHRSGKAGRRAPRMQWKIFAYVAAFAALILTLLWLFQIFLLDDFYLALSARSLRRCADRLEQVSYEELQSTADALASKNGICILIFDGGGQRIASADTQYNCLLHHADSVWLTSLYRSAQENGGEMTNRMELRVSGNEENRTPPQRLFSVRIATTADSKNIILMMESPVAPVDGVQQTLTAQLSLITAIVALASVIVAALIARRLSAPIKAISREAENLALGRYDLRFEGKGYREIQELGDTLNHAAVELSKVEALRRKLIANISHDLRTPLTLISGYSEMMRDMPGENTPENCQIILDESNRLTRLVNDLVQLSRCQDGAAAPQRCPLRLDELLRETVDRYRRLTAREGYTLLLTGDTPVTISADRDQLLQVIYNLIGNAVNYCGEDKTVEIRQIADKENVRVEIRDHGEGIEPDKLPYIWERYYKIDRVHHRADGGSGIGLSIVREILEAHGAVYGVKSEVGKGSCFYFIFPIVKETSPADGTESTQPEDPKT